MNNIDKVINLTIEYINQITSDGRVTSGLIKFTSKMIDEEKTIAMDIYVFQTNFIRHFNTHIINRTIFIRNLKEKIKQKHFKLKDYKVNINEDKIIIIRKRAESVPCNITIIY